MAQEELVITIKVTKRWFFNLSVKIGMVFFRMGILDDKKFAEWLVFTAMKLEVSK